MNATGSYSSVGIEDSIARVRAVTVSFLSHYALAVLRCSPKPLPILQAFERKSSTYSPSLETLTVSSMIPVPQVAAFTLFVSPLHLWRWTWFPNHSQLFCLVRFPIIRYTTTLLDCEVEHIWRSKWSIPNILFIISRYGVFIDMPIFITSESDYVCRRAWNAD